MGSLNIDKTHWKIVRLGDLATEISERVENPSKSRYERFVGLGNFVSGDIKIKSWESTNSLASSAKAFKEGDILFARRNAYLRRASVVDFEGCCSGDAFVLRENPEKVVPGFLPFVMNSTGLWNYANANAAGTMSKRVKWRDLAKYEFLLPPKDQQSELAELLWSSYNLTLTNTRTLNCLRVNKHAFFENSIYHQSEGKTRGFGYRRPIFKVSKLGNCINQIQYGISEPLYNSGKTPVFRMNNLQNGGLDLEDMKYSGSTSEELEKFILERGDILFNRTNSFDLVGKVSLFDNEGIYSFASYLIRIKTKPNILNSSFLSFYLNTPLGVSKIRKYRTPGVSQSNINAQNLKHIEFPLPDLIFQDSLMEKIKEYESIEKTLIKQISKAKILLTSIINQIF